MVGLTLTIDMPWNKCDVLRIIEFVRLSRRLSREISKRQIYRGSNLTLNRITPVRKEGGVQLHIASFDIKQVFDSVNMEKLYNAVKHIKMPQKLKNLVQMPLKHKLHCYRKRCNSN